MCRRARRRLETSARGLRAAQKLQDSNLLQIRVDGGAGALAESRAESSRSRQQLREMRARLQEVQTVAQRQALEVAALRKKLPEDLVAEVTRGLASDVLCQSSTHDSPAAEVAPVHASSSLDDSQNPSVLVPSTTCDDGSCRNMLSQCHDDGRSLDGNSDSSKFKQCSRDSVDHRTNMTDSVDMDKLQHEEHAAERRSQAASSRAVGGEGPESMDRTMHAYTPDNHAAPRAHIISRGGPHSSYNLDVSGRLNRRKPFWCTNTTVTTDLFSAEKTRQPVDSKPKQVTSMFMHPTLGSPGGLQQAWKHQTSFIMMDPGERASKVTGAVPVVSRRSSVGGGGGANFRSILASSQQVQRLPIAALVMYQTGRRMATGTAPLYS
jgi:hypothetical protein